MVSPGAIKHLLFLFGMMNVVTTSLACSNNTSCENCLDGGCVWVPFQGCLESCDVIADISCYDPVFFPDTTNEDICVIADDQVADQELCNNQQGCDSCVNSVLSDGTTTCQWFADGEYCASGCGMLGCGDATCSDPPANDVPDIAFNTTTLPSIACDAYVSCNECLSESCAWIDSNIGCVEDCAAVADTSCYTTSTDINVTVDDTCQKASSNEADDLLCQEPTDCQACVTTVLSDGSSCLWDGTFCAYGCHPEIGCGTDICPTNDVGLEPGEHDCDTYDTCNDCLSASCAWAPVEGCLESCSVIADTACYTNSTSPDETCTAADEDQANDTLCREQTDCESCTITEVSEVAYCQWYEDGEYCSNGCDMNGCGSITCSSATSDDDPSSDANRIISPSLGICASVIVLRVFM